MKLNLKNNKKELLYLVLVDFIIATQFVVFAIFAANQPSAVSIWAVKSFLLSFILSLPIFLFSFGVFRHKGETERIIQQGLVFFIVGNLICLFSVESYFFIFGRFLEGMASGMMLLGQLGIIWHLDNKKMSKFSLGFSLAFFLGFFTGPYFIDFLSGPSLGQVKISIILGISIAFLAILGLGWTIVRKEGEELHNLQSKNKNLAIMEIVRERSWLAFKFLFLFFLVTWFVSRNFGGLGAGILVAAAVTFLSIAHSKIFDAASDAFLDVEDEDNAKNKTKKTIVVIAKRFLYTLLDYGLAGLSVALVVAAINLKFSYLAAISAMWLIIDFPSAAILVGIYEKTGRDLTLGRSYRRMANAIFSQSKIAGTIVFIYEATLASFWSGPDYAVIFFKDELKTKIRLIAALIIITIAHSVLWTSVYWYGYEDFTGLVGRFLNRG